MAHMLVQQRVKDFAKWKMVFDSYRDLRKTNGQISELVLQDEGDPNKLTILYSWNSLSNARNYAASPALKAAMEKAGVDGPPTFSYLNEAK